MSDKRFEGVVALSWLAIATVLEIIFGIAFLIWKSKIALFLLSAQTVLWVLIIIVFALWIHGAKK